MFLKKNTQSWTLQNFYCFYYFFIKIEFQQIQQNHFGIAGSGDSRHQFIFRDSKYRSKTASPLGHLPRIWYRWIFLSTPGRLHHSSFNRSLWWPFYYSNTGNFFYIFYERCGNRYLVYSFMSLFLLSFSFVLLVQFGSHFVKNPLHNLLDEEETEPQPYCMPEQV